MKERFNAKEWDRLKRLPIQMFFFVSMADQELQSEEVAAFVSELGDALLYKDPLHSELFADLVRGDNFENAFAATLEIVNGGVQAMDQEFISTKTVLGEKVTSEEYNRFFTSMPGVGIKVGEAAGKRGKAFSTEEQMALSVFMSKFDVDLEAGRIALAKL